MQLMTIECWRLANLARNRELAMLAAPPTAIAASPPVADAVAAAAAAAVVPSVGNIEKTEVDVAKNFGIPVMPEHWLPHGYNAFITDGPPANIIHRPDTSRTGFDKEVHPSPLPPPPPLPPQLSPCPPSPPPRHPPLPHRILLHAHLR